MITPPPRLPNDRKQQVKLTWVGEHRIYICDEIPDGVITI